MALTTSQYLQRFLQSITSYYTATYSSDTEIYKLAQMYGYELSSGSYKIDEIRNNAFINVAIGDKLTPNFGSFLGGQSRYFEQNIDEDRYIAGSSTVTITTPDTTYSTANTVTDTWTFTNSNVRLVPSGSYLTNNLVVYNNSLISSNDGGALGTNRLKSYNSTGDVWNILPSPTNISNVFGTFAPKISNLYTSIDQTTNIESLYGTDLEVDYETAVIRAYLYKFTETSYTKISQLMEFTSSDLLRQVTAVTVGDNIYFGFSGYSDVETSLARSIYIFKMAKNGSLSDIDLHGRLGPSNNDLNAIGLWNNKLLISYTQYPLGDPIVGFRTFDGNTFVTIDINTLFDLGVGACYDFIEYGGRLYISAGYIGPFSGQAGEIYYYNANEEIIWIKVLTLRNNDTVLSFASHGGYLYAATALGYIYRFDGTTWFEMYGPLSGAPITKLKSFGNRLYAVFDQTAKVGYTQGTVTTYTTSTIPGTTTTTNYYGWVSIPSYRKQIQYLYKSAVHGGTLLGIEEAAQAFTLITPDIRELYKYPTWKLSAYSGSITNLSSTTVQFTPTPQFYPKQWEGAVLTKYSGSLITDKSSSEYLVKSNTQNIVTHKPLYEDEWGDGN